MTESTSTHHPEATIAESPQLPLHEQFSGLANMYLRETHPDFKPQIRILPKLQFLRNVSKHFKDSGNFRARSKKVLIFDLADVTGTNAVGREHGDRLIAAACAETFKTAHEYYARDTVTLEPPNVTLVTINGKTIDLSAHANSEPLVIQPSPPDVEISILGGDEIAVAVPDDDIYHNTHKLGVLLTGAIEKIRRPVVTVDLAVTNAALGSEASTKQVESNARIKGKIGECAYLTNQESGKFLKLMFGEKQLNANDLLKLNILIEDLTKIFGPAADTSIADKLVFYANKLVQTAISHRLLLTTSEVAEIFSILSDKTNNDLISTYKRDCLLEWLKKTTSARTLLSNATQPARIINQIKELNAELGDNIESNYQNDLTISEEDASQLEQTLLNPTFGEIVGDRSALETVLKTTPYARVFESKLIKELNDNYGMFFTDEFYLNTFYKTVLAQIPPAIADKVSIYVDIQTFYIVPNKNHFADASVRTAIEQINIENLVLGNGAFSLPIKTFTVDFANGQKTRLEIAKEADNKWNERLVSDLEVALESLKNDFSVKEIPLNMPSQIFTNSAGEVTYVFRSNNSENANNPTSITFNPNGERSRDKALKILFATMPYFSNYKRSYGRTTQLRSALDAHPPKNKQDKERRANLMQLLDFIDTNATGVNLKKHAPVGVAYTEIQDVESAQIISPTQIAVEAIFALNSLTPGDPKNNSYLRIFSHLLECKQVFFSTDLAKQESDYVKLITNLTEKGNRNYNFNVLTLIKTLPRIAEFVKQYQKTPKVTLDSVDRMELYKIFPAISDALKPYLSEHILNQLFRKLYNQMYPLTTSEI